MMKPYQNILFFKLCIYTIIRDFFMFSLTLCYDNGFVTFWNCVITNHINIFSGLSAILLLDIFVQNKYVFCEIPHNIRRICFSEILWSPSDYYFLHVIFNLKMIWNWLNINNMFLFKNPPEMVNAWTCLIVSNLTTYIVYLCLYFNWVCISNVITDLYFHSQY